ncbi:GAF domain-containing protein [Psychroflexus halocasei]|uniref:GAF domain-containing protein n=1 Tax=Psychroflexus halocasei TaxID=908615 RepID=A0A1H3ZNC7_9FLAO|nr:GAF domain-containing protein [Psychroflexus halocasei]SEA24764.1 hypothetical protein SAMN05421540_104128 [Psychroflexus halocasei]
MKQNYQFPFKISVSFKKVIQLYKERLRTEKNPIAKNYIESLLEYIAKYPELVEGVDIDKKLKLYDDIIKVVLDDIFPNMLSNNEIKAATVPFIPTIFCKSDRLDKILSEAGDGYELSPREFNVELNYIFACVIILNEYYGCQIDYRIPLYYDIPDKDGKIKTYRLFVNSDFVEIEPLDKAVEITDEDVDLLMSNPKDIDLWESYFPKNSWHFKGFTLFSFSDVTIDEQVSRLKTVLINNSLKNDVVVYDQLTSVFRNMFNVDDLEFGFTLFNQDKKTFNVIDSEKIESFILGDLISEKCENVICQDSLRNLAVKGDYFCISDVEKYNQNHNDMKLSENLISKGFKSVILAPISKGGNIIGILEIVARQKNQLNQINAIKLNAVLPYLYASAERNKIEQQNRVKAVIQSKCTSIHESVEWRFEKEAHKYIEAKDNGKNYEFEDIIFSDVFPLYGQIDIVASSEERNKAIEYDLNKQLNIMLDIFEDANKLSSLPIYEHSIFRIREYLDKIENNFTANLEQRVSSLIFNELDPVLDHIIDEEPSLDKKILSYNQLLSKDNNLIYERRKEFDQTVHESNEKLAEYIDQKQLEAQKIFPHYFERYKTDGVEHNLYIGQSISSSKKFSHVLLQNLRLWQLQVMCEMENEFYKIQDHADLPLQAASMILVFNSQLSIRYRMDEKKFDVDGTYNARYEVIKKRIDKALIKGTDERITQKGKIAIVYTSSEMKNEYKKYISYLQSKKYISNQVEDLILEDVQGVSGLKALRIEVCYHMEENEKQTISYDELMKQLH